MSKAYSNKVEANCDECGKAILRTPSSIKGDYVYCSRKCASKNHGKKISGRNNANWKGGGIEYRGERWQHIRERTLERYGWRCSVCGMSNKDHLKRYGKSLHVHHIVPYRLSMNNDDDNLTALCIPHHISAEAEIRRKLTSEEKITMLRNTKLSIESGFSGKRDRSVPCQLCGGRKSEKSNMCRSCYHKSTRLRRDKKHICQMCGGKRSATSKSMCSKCYHKSRAVKLGECIKCGASLKTKSAKLCRPCAARENGKKHLAKTS